MLSWVNAPNPLAMPTGASGSKSKTGSSNRSAMENQNQNAKNASNSSNDQSSSGDELAYLRGFRSLMGLSVREVQQVFDRPEAQLEKERRRTTSNSNSGSGRNNGNADLSGDPKGAAAVKRELDRRKAAYIRVVRTVAPALGMMRGNPAMQGEVSLSRVLPRFPFWFLELVFVIFVCFVLICLELREYDYKFGMVRSPMKNNNLYVLNSIMRIANSVSCVANGLLFVAKSVSCVV